MARGPCFLVLLGLALAVGPRGAAADPLFLPADREGSWVAADKQLHFAGSLAIATSLRVTGLRDGEAAAGAFGIAALKEVYDATLKPRARGRGASWKDLVVDLLGVGAGILLASALDGD